MQKTLRLYNQENRVLQPNSYTGEDVSFFSVEGQDGSVCVCAVNSLVICAAKLGCSLLARKSVISSDFAGKRLMQPQGMFQSRDEVSDSFACGSVGQK